MKKNTVTNITSGTSNPTSYTTGTTVSGTSYTHITGINSTGTGVTTTLSNTIVSKGPASINVSGDAIICGDIHLKGKLIFEGDYKDENENQLDILNKLKKLSSKLFPNGADTLKLSTDSTKFLNLYMMFNLTNKITARGMIFLNKLYSKKIKS